MHTRTRAHTRTNTKRDNNNLVRVPVTLFVLLQFYHSLSWPYQFALKVWMKFEYFHSKLSVLPHRELLITVYFDAKPKN